MLFVQRHAVNLRGRLVLLGRPGSAAVEADVGAAVVALDEIQRIVGVDPQSVVVTVRDADRPEARAAVDRTPEHHVQNVDRVGVLRVGLEVGVVPRPLAQLAVGAHQPELLAAVVGTEEAALFVLDQGPDSVRRRRRHRHRDAALDALGEALGELHPGVAAVCCLVNAAAGPARDHGPRFPLRLPNGGVEDARVGGIHRQIDRARLVGDEEHFGPGQTAVGRAVNPALRVGSEDVTENRRVHDVRIGRVDHDATDLTGLGKADVTPGVAGVGGLVDAVARGYVSARACGAGAHVNHIGVRRRHCDGADRRRAEGVTAALSPLDPGRWQTAGGLAQHSDLGQRWSDLAHDLWLGARFELTHRVGHIAPGLAGVGRLPHPTAGGAHVIGHGIVGDAGYRRHPAAAKRSHQTV